MLQLGPEEELTEKNYQISNSYIYEAATSTIKFWSKRRHYA